MPPLSFQRKLKSLFLVSTAGIGTYALISLVKNNEKFYKNIVMPLVHKLDPEDSHRIAILISKHRLLPKTTFSDPENLKIKLFGKELSNPIGIAAGFDKHGEAIQGLNDLGFGFVEIGSVTPKPQPGNPKPRVFRLTEDKAVINRYGFNSEGHDIVLERLKNIKDNKGVIGVNLGKNKESENPNSDYVEGVKKFAPVADYLVINISSPNTPGLRDLQSKNQLKDLLKNVIEERDKFGSSPPIFLKLAPDLCLEELKDICYVILRKQTKIDGLIISNTTIQRPQFLINKRNKQENGGLSGEPLKESSTKMISQVYKLTKGQIPIIGVGGIFSGQDAYEKIQAGASAVQIYTSLIYEGPPVVAKIKTELGELLEKDGFKNISEAVGSNLK